MSDNLPSIRANDAERPDPRMLAWLQEINDLWDAVGLAPKQIVKRAADKKLEGINPSSVSRYLHGVLVPVNRTFVDLLLEEKAQITGEPVAAETRERYYRLNRDALEVKRSRNQPHGPQIRQAYDKRDKAEADLRESETKVARLEHELAELQETLVQIQQEHHAAAQAQAAKLEREITELRAKLRRAEQDLDRAKARAEASAKEVDDLLNRLNLASPETDERNVAAHELNLPYGKPFDVATIIETLRKIGLDGYAEDVAGRVAEAVEVTYALGVARLLQVLREFDANDQAAILARRAAPDVDVTDAGGVAYLLEQLRTTGDDILAKTLAERAVPEVEVVEISNLFGIANLLKALDHPDTRPLAYDLVARVVRQSPIAEPYQAATLIHTVRALNAPGWTQLLAERATADVDVTNTEGVTKLLQQLRGIGDETLITSLVERAAPRVHVHHSGHRQQFLAQLRELGRHDLADALDRRATKPLTPTDPDNPAGAFGSPA
ncbi:hypothetical protein [Dactylosporangium sp. CA-092794]|uniref:hypothetical protein n=1 Tax=Dactylosporangium sp. CA-092794 TaxID=3239929 RepID=UPI003D8BD864